MDQLINGLSRAVDLNYITGDEAKAIARKQLGLANEPQTGTSGETTPETPQSETPAGPAPEQPAEQPAQ